MLSYAIGDIHGNIIALKRLVSYLNNPKKLIFVGDYIDKGIFVKETIDYLIDLSKNIKCVFLMGNHEYALIQYSIEQKEKWLMFLQKYGGQETVNSYIGSNKVSNAALSEMIKQMKKTNHWKFISELTLFYSVQDYYIFHSGYDSSLNSLDDVIKYNIESIFFSRSEFINSLKLLEGKKIIFGHTAFKEPYIDKYKIGIDTGAGYDGVLTAFNIEEKYFINSFGKVMNLNM